nr:DNA adenine methylase [Actinomyces sp.]
MIKYLGSKRLLVPVLGRLFAASGATTGLDLFTGTTRVAQEMCRRGMTTTAVDIASYSEVFARTYVELDAQALTPADHAELGQALAHLNALPGVRGYVTRTFSEAARYFQPGNAMRIDAVREAIETDYAGSWLYPVLLTSLIEAADAVDSTVGVQMAYLKEWAPRSARPLTLKAPPFVPGTGRALRSDVSEVVDQLDPVDVAYLDPPYNQHRYYTNYHVWETLVRWDAPEYYGVACKRLDCRDEATKSVFNRRRQMPQALAELIATVRAKVLILSFSDEGFVPLEELTAMCEARGAVEVLSFSSQRYNGARIGVFNPHGQKVSRISHTRNTEYLLVCGEPQRVEAVTRNLQA